METAAAIAPEAPAISTVLVSLVVAATPKIKPKMETVPSSIPKTIVPAELVNELRNRRRIKRIFIGSYPPLLIWIPPQGLAERGSGSNCTAALQAAHVRFGSKADQVHCNEKHRYAIT